MKRKNYLTLLLCFMAFAPIFCQEIGFTFHEGDERLQMNLLESDKLKLENGDILVRRKELLIDIFKQNVYPQDLVLITPENEIKAIRSISDSIIFKMHELDNAPHIFFTDKSGDLNFVGLDANDLSFKSEVIKLNKLTPLTKHPSKINDFSFPNIVFSEDNSLFAVMQNHYRDNEPGLDILVYSKNGNLRYQSSIQSGKEIEGIVVKIADDGQVFVLYTCEAQTEVHSVTADNKYFYSRATNSKKFSIAHSDLNIDEDGNLSFLELKVKKDNHLDSLKYTILNNELELVDLKAFAANLYYPEYSVKAVGYSRLLFNSVITSNDNEIVYLFEYCTFPPQATPLGMIITQKPVDNYLRNGAILGIRFDKDQMTSNIKLFPKKSIGYLPFMKDNTLHLVTNNKSKKTYLKHSVWNFATNNIESTDVLKKDKSKHYRFDLSNFGFLNENEALVFSWKRRRLLLSW